MPSGHNIELDAADHANPRSVPPLRQDNMHTRRRLSQCRSAWASAHAWPLTRRLKPARYTQAKNGLGSREARRVNAACRLLVIERAGAIAQQEHTDEADERADGHVDRDGRRRAELPIAVRGRIHGPQGRIRGLSPRSTWGRAAVGSEDEAQYDDALSDPFAQGQSPAPEHGCAAQGFGNALGRASDRPFRLTSCPDRRRASVLISAALS